MKPTEKQNTKRCNRISLKRSTKLAVLFLESLLQVSKDRSAAGERGSYLESYLPGGVWANCEDGSPESVDRIMSELQTTGFSTIRFYMPIDLVMQDGEIYVEFQSGPTAQALAKNLRIDRPFEGK